MAKIKGWELKRVKTTYGRGTDRVQCDIYLKGKKVGVYDSEGNNGTPRILLESQAMCDRMQSDAAAHFKEYSLDAESETVEDVVTFIRRICMLKDFERAYKTTLKKGYAYVVCYRDGQGDLIQVTGAKTAESRAKFIETLKSKVFGCFDAVRNFNIR